MVDFAAGVGRHYVFPLNANALAALWSRSPLLDEKDERKSHYPTPSCELEANALVRASMLAVK